MTVQGTNTNIFLWKEAGIFQDTQTSGVKVISLHPEGSTISIFFMHGEKLDELIEKLQELKGGENPD